MVFQEVIFWSLSVSGIIAALGVVLLRDIFRAVLLLVVVFLTLAGQFFFLAAEFVGVVQILIYAGAISILIIFAIMLTQNVQQGNLPNRLHIPAVLMPSLLLSALIFVIFNTNWNLIDGLHNGLGVDIVNNVFDDTTFRLSKLLLQDYALAFFAAGLLLLASIIGALSLVRENKNGS